CTACQQTLDSLTGGLDEPGTTNLVPPPLDVQVQEALVLQLQQALSGLGPLDANLQATVVKPRQPDAPEAAVAPRWPTVPGYEIVSVLGHGGMGIVYKARQVRLQRVVALKMMLGGDFAQEKFRARFLVEAHAVAQLQHPNIVQIHEIGEH